MASPDELLANLTAKLDEIQARTTALEHDPDAPSTTETAADGTLSVSVAPTGALTALRIEDAAWRGSGAELAERILGLAGAARHAAAVELARTLGADAAAARLITGDEPGAQAPAETDDDDFAQDRIFGGENDR